MKDNLKWLAIINPASGGGRAKRKWKKKIRNLLESFGVDFTEYITTEPNDAIKKIKNEIDLYDGFIAVGGDGTSNEVLNGILQGTIEQGKENNKLFAIIPAGTGNDLANAFDLPYKDLEASCNLLKSGNATTRLVDVGKVTGNDFNDESIVRYFCGVFSSGFDAKVAYKTNHGTKWIPGTASYVKALLTNIIWLDSSKFNVKINNGQNFDSFTKEGILIAVGVGPYYGAGMKICPDARVDDGIFHVTFLNKIPRRTLLRVFPKVYDGKHVTHKAVNLFSGPEVEIQSDDDTLWQVDGEIIGKINIPVKIETLPRILKVLSPIPESLN
ncbi:MAG: diacylglycerol kinase family protein [Candidatus Heimdallarchaeota archaeon]